MKRIVIACAGLLMAHDDFAKIQIVTIEELLGGKKPNLPWVAPEVFKRAKREMTGTQEKLL